MPINLKDNLFEGRRQDDAFQKLLEKMWEQYKPKQDSRIDRLDPDQVFYKECVNILQKHPGLTLEELKERFEIQGVSVKLL